MTTVVESSAAARRRLQIDDVVVELAVPAGSVEVVRGVSLTVRQGQIVGLIGESGSGKTMTCRAVTGALPPNARITRGTVDVAGPAGAEEDGRGFQVGMVFADPHVSLDPLQRVGPQIAEMARVHCGASRADARAEALRRLADVHISDPERVNRAFPFELSGGMAQRAMIASVLAGRPAFILADEPTSALDATIQIEVLDLLLGITREQGVGMLLTTHDMVVASRICHEIGVMYAGKLVEYGAADAVLRNPRHPYTQMLLDARPRPTKDRRLAAIPGEPPALGEMPSGCPFAPRCPRARKDCLRTMPPLEGDQGQLAACLYPVNQGRAA